MDEKKKDEIRQAVRTDYSKVARREATGCCSSSCCSGDTDANMANISAERLGYSEDELKNLPETANMGLGCGNPQAIAALQPGETVLDLGSGGGFDCFIAAKKIGETGRVIGVDMTPDMVSKARENARKSEFANVEFRLGEIEHLPVADNSIDVILSNCVINLSPDKAQVFKDAFRVLKPGGRLAISDVVMSAEMPDNIKNDLALYSACISGAVNIEELESFLTAAGFQDISIKPKEESRTFIREWAPAQYKIDDYVVSAIIEARKP